MQTDADRGSGASVVIRPFYERDGIVIYNGRCEDVLPFVGVYDLLLTDPPYGLKWGHVGFENQPLLDHTEAAEWDQRPTAETMGLAMKAARRHVVWGGNYLSDLLGPCNGPLVWNKLTGKNKYADGEMAWSDVVGTMRIFNHQWCGAFKDSERNERNVHPTQKPVALMTWCLKLAGDVASVVDPWMGSGTTLVACKLAGVRAVGIEVSERYCETAANRLRQGVLPFPCSVSVSG